MKTQAALDDGLDCLDDEDFGDYDALNDETFGSEAVAGDWEQDHEKLSQITESNRSKLKNDSNQVSRIRDVYNFIKIESYIVFVLFYYYLWQYTNFTPSDSTQCSLTV